MKKIILALIILVIAYSASAQSELMVFEDWSNNSGSQNFFYKNVVKTDLSSNTYVLGATVNDSNNYDILLAKYDRRGTLTWMRQYNGAGDGDDMGTGLYVDGSGNVYVTGTVTDTNSKNVVTIKYNSSGTQQWLKIYNGPGNDFDSGSDIITDGSGNVYVTGTSTNASSYTSVFAVKYNSSGTQQWVTNYNVAANLNDAGVKISLIGYNVAIAGVHQSSSTSYNYFTAQFNTANGNFVMIMSSGAYNVYGVDQVNDMVRDASGNIYIAGATPVTGQGYDYYVVKLNSSLGLTWQRTYNGADSLDDFAQGVRVDGSGNVYTTGFSTTLNEGRNITTIKYNSSGTQQWIQHYNDTLDGDDEAAAMAMDATGNIYVTGYISTETDNADYFTMKYNPSGSLLWTLHSDGNAHLNDKATNIVIASDGGIIITGESETGAGVYEYRTIKYVEKQVITPTDYDAEEPQDNFAYYANKGQLINTADSLVPDIKYYTNNSSPAFYIRENSYSFVFSKTDTSVSNPDTLHRIDVTFQKGKTSAKTYPMEERKDYLNYYLGHCSDGITEVRGNQRLITTDLYNNIDLMYSSNQNGIKYYYIIKPGGDPTNISMEYTGASSFYLDSASNELTIMSSIGSITYDRPTVYQLDSVNSIIDISGWTADWNTNGANNIFTFNIGAYDNTKTLVIQVDRGHAQLQTAVQQGNLWWSTNYGSPADEDNMGLDIVTSFSNVSGAGGSFIVGKTTSSTFPISSGLNQPSFGGTTDGFALHFSQDAVFCWATFYGGSGIDIAQSVAYFNNNIYFTGLTTSTNIPPIPGTNPGDGSYYKGSHSGGTDAFIAKASVLSGAISWSAYIGGANIDEARSITIDRLGNVYIAGNTTSTIGEENDCEATTGTAFPLCNPNSGSSNYYFQDFNAGGKDIFLTKFDANNFLNWSTFYGSDAEDNAFEISYSIGSTEDVYLVGNTAKNSSPSATYDGTNGSVRTDGNFPLRDVTGANDFFQAAGPGGEYIGFISRFTKDGEELWSTNLISIETFQSVVGNSNSVYVAGNSLGTNGTSSCIPTTYGGVPICNSNGGYAYYGQAKVYVANFNKTYNQLIWSSLYPGMTDVTIFNNYPDMWSGAPGLPSPPHFKTIDITLDNSQNLYLLGTSMGNLLTQQSSPAGAYFQSDEPTNGISDAYILSFNSSNNLVWATYFGAEAHPSYSAMDFPYFADWGAAIAADRDESLYITGYTGAGFSQTNTDYVFPWANPGPQATGNPYVNVETIANFAWNMYVSRFDLSYIEAGIAESNNSTSNLNVYPNPAYSNIKISFPFSKSSRYQILNMFGTIVATGKIENSDAMEINIERLNSGCYFIKISQGDTYYCEKFIKY